MPRRLPPARSPLTGRAILSGLAAAVTGDGPARAEIERWLEDRSGGEALLLTDSGTTALTVAMRLALRRRPGGTVLLPAWGCYDLVTAAVGADAGAAFYDLDPQSLTPDVPSLERAWAGDVAAVVLVHLYGVPVDPAPVRELLGTDGPLIIEDAAQGSGARIRGRVAGSLGDLAVLSFGRGKGVTAGHGGALLAPTERGERLLETPRAGLAGGGSGLLGLPSVLAQWVLSRPALYGIPASMPFLGLGETRYRPPRPGSELSRFAAGVLARTAGTEQAEAAARKRNAGRLLAAVKSLPGLTAVPVSGDSRHGWLRLPLLADEDRRSLLASHAARRLGIERGYPGLLPTLEVFGRAEGTADVAARYPGAERLRRELFTLPTHGGLRDRDLSAIRRLLDGPAVRPGVRRVSAGEAS